MSIHSESDSGDDNGNVKLVYQKTQDEDHGVAQSAPNIIDSDKSSLVGSMLIQPNPRQNEVTCDEKISTLNSNISSQKEDIGTLSSSEFCNAYTTNGSKEEDDIENSYPHSNNEETLLPITTERIYDIAEEDKDTLFSSYKLKKTAKKRNILEEKCRASDNYNECSDYDGKGLTSNSSVSGIVGIFNDEQELLGNLYMPSYISDPSPQILQGIEDTDMPVPLELRQRESDCVSRNYSDIITAIVSSSSCLVTNPATPYICPPSNIYSQPHSCVSFDKNIPPSK